MAFAESAANVSPRLSELLNQVISKLTRIEYVEESDYGRISIRIKECAWKCFA